EPPDLSATDPVFEDVDGSGDSSTLTDIELRHGYTTTEEWTLEHDGSRWWVTGTRSGKQERIPEIGEPYWTDRRELSFIVDGTASEGDRLTLTTDSGVVEHDLGGTIVGMAKVPGEALLLAGTWDGTAGAIAVFDLVTDQVRGILEFGENQQPWRFVFDGDGVLYAADAHQSAVWRIELNLDDPALSSAEVIETPGPVSALAVTDSPPTLFVAPSEANRVDLYDLETGDWIDANPYDEEVIGVDLGSPVVGLSATPEPIDLQEETEWGTPREDSAVVVTTFDGKVRILEASTGCLAIDSYGPRAATEVEFSDLGTVSNPQLHPDDETSVEIIAHSCGGITQAESWTVTWDGAVGTWEVEGSASGIQQAAASSDQRYVSDAGAVSFLILSGGLPATDGDTFSFETVSGVLQFSQIPRSSVSSEPLEIPATPLVFQYDAGPTGGGWDRLLRRTFSLVP
ncbi:MAG: hypothetical protein QGG40_20340, partial [Myxococcota bacterium]|nr:hypothetical protein [Myxococcota bacterium]